jgi:hypothetical protein
MGGGQRRGRGDASREEGRAPERGAGAGHVRVVMGPVKAAKSGLAERLGICKKMRGVRTVREAALSLPASTQSSGCCRQSFPATRRSERLLEQCRNLHMSGYSPPELCIVLVSK